MRGEARAVQLEIESAPTPATMVIGWLLGRLSWQKGSTRRSQQNESERVRCGARATVRQASTQTRLVRERSCHVGPCCRRGRGWEVITTRKPPLYVRFSCSAHKSVSTAVHKDVIWNNFKNASKCYGIWHAFNVKRYLNTIFNTLLKSY